MPSKSVGRNNSVPNIYPAIFGFLDAFPMLYCQLHQSEIIINIQIQKFMMIYSALSKFKFWLERSIWVWMFYECQSVWLSINNINIKKFQRIFDIFQDRWEMKQVTV